MKGGQNLRELQQKKTEGEPWVKPQPCVICGKVIPGAYGHHGDAANRGGLDGNRSRFEVPNCGGS